MFFLESFKTYAKKKIVVKIGAKNIFCYNLDDFFAYFRRFYENKKKKIRKKIKNKNFVREASPSSVLNLPAR